MPEEIFVIIIFSIIAGTVMSIIRSILGYRERIRLGTSADPEPESRRERRQNKRLAKQGASLTTSELEEMMRRAVTDATEPLRGHLAGIEDRIDALEAKAPRIDLDAHLESDPGAMSPTKTIGARAR